MKPSELACKILNYEAGGMTDEEIIDLFQYLIDSGLAWTLQGSYGRTATSLINAGLCKERSDHGV